MTTSEFAKRLKQLRKGRHLTQKDLAAKTGATQVAISCWEAGSRFPTTEYLRSLCKALDVSADTLLDIPPKQYENAELFGSTQDELDLLSIYRELDDFGKSAVNFLARHERERVAYRVNNVVELEEAVGERYIPKYISSAAAGIAAPIDTAEYEMVLVDKSVPSGADYAVVIQGTSMEPVIRDGSTVYVKKTSDLKSGDVGVFSVNGAVVCKLYFRRENGDIELISINPEERWSNVKVKADSSETLECLGRVLTKYRVSMPDYFMESFVETSD